MRPSRRTDRWCLVGLVLAVLIGGGCFVGPRGRTAGPEAPPPPTASAPVTGAEAADAGADGTMSVEEFERDIVGAVRLAERYWAEQFAALGESFRPIRNVTAYRREGEVACAGTGLPRNNAVYCSRGDFIAYDVMWAVAAFRKIGDAFLYYLLGHEYAHGIQVRLGIRYDYTIQQELQADCMAGAYLGDSVRSGALILDDGDLDELREGLQAVADEPGQPWFAEDAHGTAEQRASAFFGGFQKSLDACDL
ncbi:neutral zinc metallopeptidase [Micromonospora sp. HM5-17]|jgi:predicted metalloprotease|uniref:neutral zinc metallopeptidase n=1 Tax=Micromonospora sp. HM5-17 TaxID=2487710 RepID=UPI000F4A5F69|nr:neutral zinc metallopeptidase [Micromonospora sp. HM5-17]ROT29607.1 hypothetical protein EF879_18315 [Micromonospora sp. HM5-17]